MTDDVRVRTRPLQSWPGTLRAEAHRLPPPFTVRWSDTTLELDREARLTGATDAVIQLAITEADIRLDGWPYARAKPSHPGVTLVLVGDRIPYGRLSFSTDRFTGGTVYPTTGRRSPFYMEGWQANLRAIVKALGGMRAADRYGVLEGRQYAGFRELTAGSGPSRDEAGAAVAWLAAHTGYDEGDLWYSPERKAAGAPHGPSMRAAYREAAKVMHPDRGGDPDEWEHLTERVRPVVEATGHRP